MPTKREIVEALGRGDLIALVDHFDIDVPDRRVKQKLVSALQSARKVSVAGVLEQLSLASLKELCAALDVQPTGRGKQALIECLDESPSVKAPVKAARKAAAAKATPVIAAKSASVTKKAPDPKKVKAAPVIAAKSASVAKKAPEPKKDPKRAPAVKKASVVEAEPTVEPSEAESAPVPVQTAPTTPKVSRREIAFNAAHAAFKAPAQAPAPEVPPAAPKKAAKLRAVEKKAKPADETGENKHKCAHCRKPLQIRKCVATLCHHVFVSEETGRICSECAFERGTVSMSEFLERSAQETACPHCHRPWQAASRSA